MSTQLELSCFQENKESKNDITIKMQVCNILDQILNYRQEFLIKNILTFFKHFVIQKINEEHNEVEED